MATTYELYPGDGVQTDFHIKAPYLDEDYITVHVDGDPVDFELINPGMVRIVPAPPNGSSVRVGRDTPRDELIVTIPTSGNFDTNDINKQSQQVLHIVAEAFDKLEGTLALNLVGHWDGFGLRFMNLAWPVDPGDAVTKEWAETAMSSELAQATSARNAAQAAQAASEGARDTAQSYMNTTGGYKDVTYTYQQQTFAARDVTFEARDATLAARDVALGARDTALTHRNAAEGFKTEAMGYRDTALTHRNAAAGSASAADASATNAANSALAAANSAAQAASSAEALGNVRINGANEVEFEVNGVVVAKIDASGNFLLKGNVGIFQIF